MSNITLIIKKEYLQRIEKRSFIITTLLVPIFFIASCTIPVLLINREEVKTEVAEDHASPKAMLVVDKSGLYEEVFKSDTSGMFIYTSDPDVKIEQGNALMIHREIRLGNKEDITFYVTSGNRYPAALQQAYELLNRAVRESEIASATNPETKEKLRYFNLPLRSTIVDLPVEEKSDSAASSTQIDSISKFVGIMFTLFIYMFLLTYGMQVMHCVTQEKVNRVVEVIVSSVKPFDLMLGKIIGIGLVGITQFCIWGGLIGLLYNFLPTVEIPQQERIFAELQTILAELPIRTLLVSFILYFIGGYLLYASCFAAIGSAIDNETDSQQLIMPITIVLIFSLYIALFGSSSPDSPLVFWTSLFPLTSPIVMMTRIPHGVPLWELALSIALLYGTFLIFTQLAGRIYQVGILMYGKKPTLREIIKWIHYKL